MCQIDTDIILFKSAASVQPLVARSFFSAEDLKLKAQGAAEVLQQGVFVHTAALAFCTYVSLALLAFEATADAAFVRTCFTIENVIALYFPPNWFAAHNPIGWI